MRNQWGESYKHPAQQKPRLPEMGQGHQHSWSSSVECKRRKLQRTELKAQQRCSVEYLVGRGSGSLPRGQGNNREGWETQGALCSRRARAACSLLTDQTGEPPAPRARVKCREGPHLSTAPVLPNKSQQQDRKESNRSQVPKPCFWTKLQNNHRKTKISST